MKYAMWNTYEVFCCVCVIQFCIIGKWGKWRQQWFSWGARFIIAVLRLFIWILIVAKVIHESSSEILWPASMSWMKSALSKNHWSLFGLMNAFNEDNMPHRLKELTSYELAQQIVVEPQREPGGNLGVEDLYPNMDSLMSDYNHPDCPPAQLPDRTSHSPKCPEFDFHPIPELILNRHCFVAVV